MRNKAILALIAGITPLVGQTTFIDGAGDPSWSNPGNWSTGAVPTTTAAVVIPATPQFGIIGIDTGATIIGSLTINSGVAGFSFESALGDTLQVGNITNNSSETIVFNLPVFAGAASQTWDGPLTFNNVIDLSTRSVTLAGVVDFNGSDLSLSIANATTYGRFLGAGNADVNGVTINVTGAFTGGFVPAEGQSFDFTSGSFTGATLNIASLPTLSSGLQWNTTQFISEGILTVVPEPSTWAALAGMAVLGVAASRRRRSA